MHLNLVLLCVLALVFPGVLSHVYSVLFDAQDVRDHLSNDGDVATGISWCKAHGITKVYLETFRDGYTVDKNVISRAKQLFEQAGFNVSGCVCTTDVGKPSTGWDLANCYTNTTTQVNLQSIFEFTAAIFDHIIIDDFFFTDCECSECQAARATHQVTVAGNHVPYLDTVDLSCPPNVEECTWKDYRSALMLEVSKVLVLAAAKKVNPSLLITIKYPDWYDMFQDYGYDTVGQSQIFDQIWVGTETRDYYESYKPQYSGFFNMRWLGSVQYFDEKSHQSKLSKAGGGWFDWIDSSPATYIEQARMTILGGARESFLFVYGGLISGSGVQDIEALAKNMPELLAVASEVEKREIVGVAAYKPPNSHGGCVSDPKYSAQCVGEIYVFDFIGMLGIPLYPTREFPDPKTYPAAFFSIHSLKDAQIVSHLTEYIGSGNPTLVTDGLVSALQEEIDFNQDNVVVIPVKGVPTRLLSIPPVNIADIRASLLQPLNLTFNAAVNVSYFPFTDNSWVIANFNDYDTNATVGTTTVNVPARGWRYYWNSNTTIEEFVVKNNK